MIKCESCKYYDPYKFVVYDREKCYWGKDVEDCEDYEEAGG